MSHSIISEGPEHLHIECTNDEEEWQNARMEYAIKFFSSLPAEAQRRIYFQEFDSHPITGQRQGSFQLDDNESRGQIPTQWFIMLKANCERLEVEEKEARKVKLLESIPAMTDEELASYLREFTGCGKALNEALARLLEGRVSPSTR